MGRLVGTWVLGDTMKDFRYTVENVDGTPRDLTGATVTLEGRRQTDTALVISIVGVIDAVPATGKVVFSAITAGLSLGNARRQVFVSRVKVVQSGKTGWVDEFDIAVEKWP